MPQIHIEAISLPTVWHVVKNMRRSDWLEISNLVPRRLCSVDGIAMLVMQQTGVGFVALVDDVPTCVVQLVEKHDGCWSAGLFATDDFNLCWRTVVKEIKHVVIPTLFGLEARYCEAMVMVQNRTAEKLLKSLGFEQKSKTLDLYGAFGKDFALWSMNRKDLKNVYRPTKDQRPGATN